MPNGDTITDAHRVGHSFYDKVDKVSLSLSLSTLSADLEKTDEIINIKLAATSTATIGF